MKINLHFSIQVVVLVVLSLLLNGCAPFQHGVVQITDPHQGNTFPSGQPITIRVSVADLSNLGGLSAVAYEYVITDNDQIIAHVGHESLNQRNIYVIENTAPVGIHWVSVQVRAARVDSDQPYIPSDPPLVFTRWYPSNDVCFFVGSNPPPDFCATRTVAYPVQVAPSPTLTLVAPTAIPVIDNVSAFPAPIYYGDTCPALSTVTFRAALSLPNGTTPDLIDAKAHVSVRVGTSGTNSGNMVVPLQSTQTWDTASGGLIFSGTLALTHSYNDANNQFDLASLGGSPGALLWYVDASSHDPSFQNALFLGRSPNQVLDLAPCPQASQNRPHNPGGGTGSSSGGNGPASGCSQYGNQTSCDLAGCSWDPQASSCSVSP